FFLWIKAADGLHLLRIAVHKRYAIYKPGITRSRTSTLNLLGVVLLVVGDQVAYVEHIQHILIDSAIELMLDQLLKAHQLCGMVPTETLVVIGGPCIGKRIRRQVQYAITRVVVQ